MNIRRLIIFGFFLVGSLLVASEKLYDSLEWQTLLHIDREGQPEISDKKFLLSNPFSPKNEFDYFLAQLKNKDKCEMLCKFPARYKFISKNMDLNLTFEHCAELQDFMKISEGDSASFVYASSYLASPMSYFGHTFIKINKPKADFFAQTISFAAEVPPQIGFFDLSIKGTTGGFDGKYAYAPYFKLIDSYNSIEQRSLTEYELNLNSDEIETMLMHAYELADVSVPYKFFSKNCTYQMLWFLDVARPTIKLHDKFDSFVIPYQVLETIKSENLIVSTKTIPSNIETIFNIYNTMDDQEANLLALLKNSDSKEYRLNMSDIDSDKKNKVVFILNSYYDFMFKRFRIAKADFAEVKSLPLKPVEVLHYKNDNSVQGSSKVKIGRFYEDGKYGNELEITPILLNRLDDYSGNIGESTLEFLNINLQYINDISKVDKVDLLKLESLSQRFEFYKPISWRFRIGADRKFFDGKLEPTIELGMGHMYGYKSVKLYIMPQAETLGKNAGFSALAGVSVWQNNAHIGLDLKRSIIFLDNNKPNNKSVGFVNFPITEKARLEISVDGAQNRYAGKLLMKF